MISSPLKELGGLRGSAAELKSLQKAEEAARKNAQQTKILTPDEVNSGTMLKNLTTTHGGVLRALTHEDLATFRREVSLKKERFKGGITARQVITLSDMKDRQRAKEEIHVAVPVATAKDTIRFMTDASRKYGATRHHVLVRLLSFDVAVAAGDKTAKQQANWIRKQPLAFDCDCGRHRFWYRYISTIGKFNAGRAETGYPKIRNPGLTGVACKHVLRVMAEFESSQVILSWLERWIGAAKKDALGKANIKSTQKEADDLAAKQKARKRTILDEDQRKAKAAQSRAKRQKAQEELNKKVQPDTEATKKRKARMTKQDLIAILKQHKPNVSDEELALFAALSTEQIKGFINAYKKGK